MGKKIAFYGVNEMEFGTGLRVVIVNGRPGCGKTSFENICQGILGSQYCKSRSSIDKIKEIATMGGWQGSKNLKDRKLLSDLKRVFTEYNDLPTLDIIKFLSSWESNLENFHVGGMPHILFVDVREPKNIANLKKILNATTLLIRRPGDDDIDTSNDSDLQVFEYDYDWVINNDGSFKDLESAAERFINWIFS